MRPPRKRDRRSFFAADDRSVAGPAGLTEKYLPFERARRQKLLGSAITDAEQLIGALRAARAFDDKGNIEHAAVQIADTLDDVLSHTTNFLNDVAAAGERLDRSPSEDRDEDEDPAAAIEPTPQASAAADISPKPGPHILSVQVFSADGSPTEQLTNFDRAAAAKAQPGPRPGNWIRVSDAVGQTSRADAVRAGNEVLGAAFRAVAQHDRDGLK